jgi:RHH-type rel operon transcriptional repressor/antitoxin RelB
MLMIAISESLEKRLAGLARRSGRSIDQLTLEAILSYLEDSEDAHEAERVLRRVRAGLERTYSLEEVAKRLRLKNLTRQDRKADPSSA